MKSVRRQAVVVVVQEDKRRALRFDKCGLGPQKSLEGMKQTDRTFDLVRSLVSNEKVVYSRVYVSWPLIASRSDGFGPIEQRRPGVTIALKEDANRPSL